MPWVAFYCCDEYRDQKQPEEDKDCFNSYFQFMTEGSQDGQLEAGADAEAVQGCCLLICPHSFHVAFLYRHGCLP